MSDNHDLHDEHISKLYRMGSKDQPSKQLDDKIIQAARRYNPARKSRFDWPSLASAAVLVLSIGLVLKVLTQAPLEESLQESNLTKHGSTPPPALELRMEQTTRVPTPVIQDRANNSMGAARFKSAPAGKNRIEINQRKLLQPEAAPNAMYTSPESDISKAKKGNLDCSIVPLPESNSIETWQQQYQTALKQGQNMTAECIKQGFLHKFGQDMPKIEHSDIGTTQ